MVRRHASSWATDVQARKARCRRELRGVRPRPSGARSTSGPSIPIMTSPSSQSRSSSRTTARPLRRALTADDGFSLIEVIATALVTVLLGAAMATGLIAQAHASGDQQMRSEADALVNQDQDRLRGVTDQALSNLASTGPTTSNPQVVGNESYTITSSAAYQTSAGSSSCASSSTAYFKISSQVSWTESFANNSTQTVSANSLLTRPVTGQLQTLVTDQTNAGGLAGVSVTATPPSGSSFPGQTGTTDSTGCSLFAGLGVANYAVTASKPGWVTPQNATTAYATARGDEHRVSRHPDPGPRRSGRPARSPPNFQAASPSAPGQADGVMYSGTGVGYPSVSGQGSTTTLPAASQTASSLFPFETTAGSRSTPTTTHFMAANAHLRALQRPISPRPRLPRARPPPRRSRSPSSISSRFWAMASAFSPATSCSPTALVAASTVTRRPLPRPVAGSGIGATAPGRPAGWQAPASHTRLRARCSRCAPISTYHLRLRHPSGSPPATTTGPRRPRTRASPR